MIKFLMVPIIFTITVSVGNYYSDSFLGGFVATFIAILITLAYISQAVK